MINNEEKSKNIMNATTLLPKEVECPGCGSVLELSPIERERKIIFCPECAKEYNLKSYEDKTTKKKTNEKRVEKMAISNDEKVLMSIGQKFLVSFLVGEGFYSTSLVVTNKRIYGAGEGRTITGLGQLSFVGDLSSLSSFGFAYHSSFLFLFLGILGMIIGLIAMNDNPGFLIIFIIGLFLFIAYFMTKKRFLIINFNGYAYTLSMRGVPNSKLQEFIKIAMVAREKFNKN